MTLQVPIVFALHFARLLGPGCGCKLPLANLLVCQPVFVGLHVAACAVSDNDEYFAIT